MRGEGLPSSGRGLGEGGGAKEWLHHSEPSPRLLQSEASARSPEHRSGRDANLRVSRALADMKEMEEHPCVCECHPQNKGKKIVHVNSSNGEERKKKQCVPDS